MQHLTKKAIRESFIRFINTKPLDKITVKDIVEDCGITRNTFYYYYQDIYELVDELFQQETQRVLGAETPPGNWAEGLIAAMQFVLENKRAVHHLYHSARREEVERHLSLVIEKVLCDYVEQVVKDIPAREEDKRGLASFYHFAVVGSILAWLQSGMEGIPEAQIRRLGQLLDGSIRTALERSTTV